MSAPERDQSGLLRKYRELLGKHERLVERLEERAQQRSWLHQLAHWVLGSEASGVALISDDAIRVTNARWQQLNRAPSGWVPAAGGEPYSDLRQVARHEAQILIETGGALRIVRYQHKAGDVAVQLRVERTGGDESPGALVLAHDVTDVLRAERELAATRERLARRERLRSLGELAAGIAHDLDSTVMAARVWTARLLGASEEERGEVVRRLGETLEDAATRIRRLQEFAKNRSRDEAGPVRLGPVVQDAVELVRACREVEAFRIHVSPAVEQLPPVIGPEGELRFVLANVLLNAADSGGRIEISAQSGAEVVLCVEDTGVGIPEDVLPHLFEPLFTTKGGKGGQGLGLAMAHEVMARVGGELRIQNRPTHGVKVELVFRRAEPVSPLPPAAHRGAVPARTRAGGARAKRAASRTPRGR